MALLEVEDLTVTLRTARGPARAVRGASFSLDRGASLGIVGESGSGKTMTALAVMGLLPDGAAAAGHIRFDGQELVGLDDPAFCRLRGDRMALVFQEPMTALNPVQTIGDQVAEPLVLHRGATRGAALREAVRLLDRVGLPDAAHKAAQYPHQLSGGQRQRATIAMALACGPDLLIADEPTTALDVTIQRQILDLIAELVAESHMSLILVSHDLGIIAETVDRVLVMYGGTVVESGPTEALFARLAHPYTQGLFAARPKLDAPPGTRLSTIPGSVPELLELPPGCVFSDRCPLAIPACRAAVPPPVAVGADHIARCIRLDAR
jgi:peptide/nickel transport system ATP-binding protein